MGQFLSDFFFRIESFLSKRRVWLLAALVLLLLLIPAFGFSRFVMRLYIVMGIYSMLVLGFNMVAGYTGQLSLGNAAFYAIGAYTSTLFMLRLGTNFWIALVAAAVLAGLSGLMLGLPTLRLKGPYLTIVTLGFGEIVRMILMNWESVTNGTLGIRSIPLPVFFGIRLSLANHGLYYLMLFLLFLVSLFCVFVINSKTGRAFVAIREDEVAAQMMGIRTVRYKVLAFVLSAAISGVAGGFYAPLIGYIDPNSFPFDISSLIICMAILVV